MRNLLRLGLCCGLLALSLHAQTPDTNPNGNQWTDPALDNAKAEAAFKPIAHPGRPTLWLIGDSTVLRGAAKSDGTSTALTVAGETVTAPRRLAGEANPVMLLRPEKLAGHGLDEQAFNAIKQWRFAPATSTTDGKPVAIIVPVEVTFRLR